MKPEAEYERERVAWIGLRPRVMFRITRGGKREREGERGTRR
jgi:hypothetical protein